MPVQVCSLICKQPQKIPGDHGYHIVRFEFGAESSDRHRMHETQQPDGVSTTFAHDRAGLIWPSMSGWGELKALCTGRPVDAARCARGSFAIR